MIRTFSRMGDLFGIYLGVPTNKRYLLAKEMIEKGGINRFEQLVELLPYTTIAKDIGINHNRMKRILYENVGELKLRELSKMARVLKINRSVLADLVCEVMDRKG